METFNCSKCGGEINEDQIAHEDEGGSYCEDCTEGFLNEARAMMVVDDEIAMRELEADIRNAEYEIRSEEYLIAQYYGTNHDA